MGTLPPTLALGPARGTEDLLDIPAFIEVRCVRAGPRERCCAADEDPQRSGCANRKLLRAWSGLL